MTSRKISIENINEIPLYSTLRMRPDVITVMDVTADDWDFMTVIATGHAGGLASPSGCIPDAMKRLNIIIGGKTGKGKITKFKRKCGGKHGR